MILEERMVPAYQTYTLCDCDNFSTGLKFACEPNILPKSLLKVVDKLVSNERLVRNNVDSLTLDEKLFIAGLKFAGFDNETNENVIITLDSEDEIDNEAYIIQVGNRLDYNLIVFNNYEFASDKHFVIYSSSDRLTIMVDNKFLSEYDDTKDLENEVIDFIATLTDVYLTIHSGLVYNYDCLSMKSFMEEDSNNFYSINNPYPYIVIRNHLNPSEVKFVIYYYYNLTRSLILNAGVTRNEYERYMKDNVIMYKDYPKVFEKLYDIAKQNSYQDYVCQSDVIELAIMFRDYKIQTELKG